AAPVARLPVGHAARRRTRLLVAVALALTAAAAAIGYWRSASKSAPAYVTVPVTRGTVARSVSASGTVNPQLTIIVGSYVSGVIQELSCDYNTRVKKGQVCANIDPRPYQTAVDQAIATLGTARAQQVKDEAALAYARLTHGRDLELVKDGYVSQDAVDSARSAVDQAQASVELDRATVRQRQAELQAAQVNIGYTRIVSPVDGTVVSRNVTIGQTVAASFQTPTLFLIATDLTRMEVDTNVSESDVGGLKPGDKASFTVEAFPKRAFTGSVMQIRQAPQTVQNVVTYDVVVDVDNADLALMPGMTATTRIITAERDGVLRVSDQSLRYAPTGASAAPSRLWLLRAGKPVAVDVALGLDDDSNTEITGGAVQAGDLAIVGEQHGEAGKGSSAPFRFGL
ncbi:MAG: efflux RND transporter periplasmic adaptor subunit, partial [Nevskia sp.]|nr:efflux RND transporter periplasmic adaptor subunit [Nevskia sp.]